VSVIIKVSKIQNQAIRSTEYHISHILFDDDIRCFVTLRTRGNRLAFCAVKLARLQVHLNND